MSVEDKIEEEAYRAVAAVGKILRPKERRRVCLELLKGVCRMMEWEFCLDEAKEGGECGPLG